MATADVFRAYAKAAVARDLPRARDISEPLAADMRVGLAAATLLERLLDLASANSLRPAAESLVPGLREFVAELESMVDRPVCQSGSGPTLWSLYPTLVDARKAVRLIRLAVANGTLPLLGTGEPFVAATTIAGRPIPPPVLLPGRTMGTIRPRTVHNESGANGHGHDEPAAEPVESKGDQTR